MSGGGAALLSGPPGAGGGGVGGGGAQEEAAQRSQRGQLLPQQRRSPRDPEEAWLESLVEAAEKKRKAEEELEETAKQSASLREQRWANTNRRRLGGSKFGDPPIASKHAWVMHGMTTAVMTLVRRIGGCAFWHMSLGVSDHVPPCCLVPLSLPRTRLSSFSLPQGQG